jgi:hypothetical protein
LKQKIFSILILLLAISCGQVNRVSEPIPPANDSNSVVLKYDTVSFSTFPLICKNAQPTDLTTDEINETDKLTYQCITKYNDSLLDMTEYKRQYIPVLNDMGQKVVWVNYFCNNLAYWKKQPVKTYGGGRCYFQLKVNLSEKYYYDFSVNGNIGKPPDNR